MTDRCSVGAGCSLDSQETLPTGTVLHGRECHRYTKKIPTQVIVLYKNFCVNFEASIALFLVYSFIFSSTKLFIFEQVKIRIAFYINVAIIECFTKSISF